MKWLVPAIIIGAVSGFVDGLTDLHKVWCFLIGVASFVCYLFVESVVKAKKAPDVIEASYLRMDIRRFKKYKTLYDDLQETMAKYGADSIEATQFFKETIWPKVKNNPNEWRRYQKYREVKYQEEFTYYINRILYNKSK